MAVAVHKYFYNGGLNCAESTVRLFAELTGSDIPHDLIKVMSGFGGGMQRGLTCGAVTASVALLGFYTGRTETYESREPSAVVVGEYLKKFEDKFSALTCCELCKGYMSKSDEMYDHCTQFVTESVKIIANILNKKIEL